MKYATIAVVTGCLLALAGVAHAGGYFSELSRMNKEAVGADSVSYDADGDYYWVQADPQDRWWSGADSDDGVLFGYDLWDATGYIEITARQYGLLEWDGTEWTVPDPARSDAMPHGGIMLRNFVDTDGNERPDGSAMFLSVGGGGAAYPDWPGLAREDNTGEATEVAAVSADHEWFRVRLDVDNNLGRIWSSADGADWSQVGDDIAFTGAWGDQIAAGLYLSGDHDDDDVYVGSGFDNVSVTHQTPPPPPPPFEVRYNFDDQTGSSSVIGTIPGSATDFTDSGVGISFDGSVSDSQPGEAAYDTPGGYEFGAGPYMTFTVTADSGVLDPVALTFDAMSLRRASGRTTMLAIGSSLDDFTNPILFDWQDLEAETSGAGYEEIELGQVGDASSSSRDVVEIFADLSELGSAEEIEFRIYTGRGGSLGHRAAIDNVVFTAVPEPATFAFLALGGLAMLRRRRG